jgi:glutaminyl-peptide cyclotransferase
LAPPRAGSHNGVVRRVVFTMIGVQAAIVVGFLALVFTGVVGLGGVGEEGDGAQAAASRADRFDERRAFATLREQVALGPRPAGSAASRRLAHRLRARLPRARFQPVPGGLRNVIGSVPGRDPRRTVIVGAHYDTKDAPGFVGANDGASGTAAVLELARGLRPRSIRPTVVFMLFDGEESPADAAEYEFEEKGLRGSKVAAAQVARAPRRPEAMILLDFVGDRDLSIPREGNSDKRLWARLRSAAGRVGAGRAFPPSILRGDISDDHVPFLAAGIPSIDLIDFTFPCFHRRCDDLSAVSPRSLDLAGEAVAEMLRAL